MPFRTKRDQTRKHQLESKKQNKKLLKQISIFIFCSNYKLPLHEVSVFERRMDDKMRVTLEDHFLYLIFLHQWMLKLHCLCVSVRKAILFHVRSLMLLKSITKLNMNE